MMTVRKQQQRKTRITEEFVADQLLLLWDKTKYESLYPCVPCDYVVLDF